MSTLKSDLDGVITWSVCLANVHAAQGRTADAGRILEEGYDSQQKALLLNPEHSEGLSNRPDFLAVRGSLEAQCGRIRSATALIEEALTLQTEMHRQHPDDQVERVDLFETLIASVLLDVKAGRPTAAARITEIHRLIQEFCRQTGDDPKNIWAASEAVSGYVALAERALASKAPDEARTLLEQASGLLAIARQTSPDLLVLRSLTVRLEMMRSENLRRLGKSGEAAAAAGRAATVADALAREDSAYLFLLACAKSVQAQLDRSIPGLPKAAVDAIRSAIKAGFDNAYKLETYERLTPLFVRDDFQALIRLLKDKTAATPGRSDTPGP